MSADPALELLSVREFAAARARVFAACSDPVLLAQWWGPRGFTNTFEIFDFRPGGTWRFTMHAPDDTGYAMDHRFTEIVAPERIVVRHLQPGHDFTLAMIFADLGERSRLTWRMRFDDPAEAEKVRAFILPANEQNFDRLAALLSRDLSGTGPAVR